MFSNVTPGIGVCSTCNARFLGSQLIQCVKCVKFHCAKHSRAYNCSKTACVSCYTDAAASKDPELVCGNCQLCTKQSPRERSLSPIRGRTPDRERTSRERTTVREHTPTVQGCAPNSEQPSEVRVDNPSESSVQPESSAQAKSAHSSNAKPELRLAESSGDELSPADNEVLRVSNMAILALLQNKLERKKGWLLNWFDDYPADVLDRFKSELVIGEHKLFCRLRSDGKDGELTKPVDISMAIRDIAFCEDEYSVIIHGAFSCATAHWHVLAFKWNGHRYISHPHTATVTLEFVDCK